MRNVHYHQKYYGFLFTLYGENPKCARKKVYRMCLLTLRRTKKLKAMYCLSRARIISTRRRIKRRLEQQFPDGYINWDEFPSCPDTWDEIVSQGKTYIERSILVYEQLDAWEEDGTAYNSIVRLRIEATWKWIKDQRAKAPEGTKSMMVYHRVFPPRMDATLKTSIDQATPYKHFRDSKIDVIVIKRYSRLNIYGYVPFYFTPATAEVKFF